MLSSTGMNLKMGEHVRRKVPEILVVVSLHFFGSTCTICRFGERFRDGQYSLVSFLFAVLLTVPPCPAICKSGGTYPRALQSRCHWLWGYLGREVYDRQHGDKISG